MTNDKQIIRNTARQMAANEIEAEERFIQAVQNFIDVTDQQAYHILKVYKKYKMVKLIRSMRQYQVKHGSYFDKKVLRKALKQSV